MISAAENSAKGNARPLSKLTATPAGFICDKVQWIPLMFRSSYPPTFTLIFSCMKPETGAVINAIATQLLIAAALLVFAHIDRIKGGRHEKVSTSFLLPLDLGCQHNADNSFSLYAPYRQPAGYTPAGLYLQILRFSY